MKGLFHIVPGWGRKHLYTIALHIIGSFWYHHPKREDRTFSMLFRMVIIGCFILSVVIHPCLLKAQETEGPGPAPERLVDKNGKFNYGWFQSPIREVNLDDAIPEEGFGGSFLKAFKKKRWQSYLIDGKEILLGMTMRDYGYLGSFTLYILIKETKALIEYRFT